MDTIQRFSQKVDGYTRYRWDYAEEAIRAVIAECRISSKSVIADIGSGTGILTRHFVDRVGSVVAVEPSLEMRAIAAEQDAGRYQILHGFAEATTLPSSSVDMITVGRALHWFQPDSTRAEFCRILKPSGWMAVFSVEWTDQELCKALKILRTAENGWDAEADHRALTKPVPLGFYFGHETFRNLRFPHVGRETWDDFLGRISSFSAAPGPDHPMRPKFVDVLYQLFAAWAHEGNITVHRATGVAFGHLQPSAREEIGHERDRG